MTPTVYALRSMDEEGRRSAVSHAARALDAGELVVFATETVYGVGASASSAAALDRLASATGQRPPPIEPGGDPWTWHAGSVDDAMGVLRPTLAVERWLLIRLAPGPVTFVVERDEATLARVRGALGVGAGVIDNGSAVSVRVPDHESARALLGLAESPIVACGVEGATFGGDAVSVVLDDGRPRFGTPSTVVRIEASGRVTVAREGALEARHVHRRLERTIVLVCTGNTCRSPMGEAIAREVLARHPTPGLVTHVRSAGVGATAGAPVSPEAVEAVGAIGLDPAHIQRHRAHELTRELIASADEIWVMTESHRRDVLLLDHAAPVSLLDPEGGSVADPIGGPQTAYTRTARRLLELVERRVRMLDGRDAQGRAAAG